MESKYNIPFKLPEDFVTPGGLSSKNVGKEIPMLFTPLKIRDMELKNRVVVAPMCMYAAVDGIMNDFHMVHYGSFSKGGASLVIMEASAVSVTGRISTCDAGIYSDDQIPAMKRINNFLHVNDCKAGIQLSHAGRKSSTVPPFLKDGRKGITVENGGWSPHGVSAVPFNQYSVTPLELSLEEIKETIRDFGLAAKRALEADFDVLEIHGAHGYLIDSFLSSTSNKRTDEYGGSFEGRIKFVLDIAREVRLYWPESKPLFLRLSCTEYVESGWKIEDTVRLSQIIQEQGLIDLIDCSSGGNSFGQQITVKPLYQVEFAHQVKLNTSLKSAAVGLILNGPDAESVLQQGKADLVMIGRPFLKNPFFTFQLASDLNIDLETILQYNQSRR